MEDNILDQLKSKSLQEVVDKTNSKFYKWIKRILLLNSSRVVQLSTYLLNFNITHKYFSWLNALIKEMPDIMPKDLTSEKLREFTVDTEKIYGLFILLSMRYKSLDTLNTEETDNLIDELHRYGPLIEQFFTFNSIDPELYNSKLIDLVNYIKDYSEMDKLFPDLSFDPLFQDVMKSDAVKQLFDTSYITDFFNFIPPKKFNYVASRNLVERSIKANKNNILFQISPKLSISKFFRESLKYFGVTFLGSHKQIDDIIDAFQKYYEMRVPSKKGEIKEFLTCFGELLKLAEGMLYKKYKFTTLKKKLVSKIQKRIVNTFLKKFCLFRANITLPSNYGYFKAVEFLYEYNEYLLYALYNFSGFVYTGVFLIWRSLIKYLETLQNQKEFKDQKGVLLENWCYEQAVEFEFNAKCIILRNPEKSLSQLYKKMKERNALFLGPTIEVDATFPNDYLKSSYDEIDLAIRTGDYLFLFECKATSAPLGEQSEFIKWIDYNRFNLTHLVSKANLILFNLDNDIIHTPFLKGAKKVIPFLVQTEGLLAKYNTIPIRHYIVFLRTLKEHIENNTMNRFIEGKKFNFS